MTYIGTEAAPTAVSHLTKEAQDKVAAAYRGIAYANALGLPSLIELESGTETDPLTAYQQEQLHRESCMSDAFDELLRLSRQAEASGIVIPKPLIR